MPKPRTSTSTTDDESDCIVISNTDSEVGFISFVSVFSLTAIL